MSLRIDTPTFRATAWQAGEHNGRAMRWCACWEWEGGKWEGFTAMEFTAGR